MTTDADTHATIVRLSGRGIACLNADEARATYQELWQQRAYLHGGITLSEGSVVIDAGANIGLFALWAYERCAREARIHCFEPVPQVFDLLQKNVGDLRGVSAHPFGLSDREEQDDMRFHPKISLWSTRHRAMDENRLSEMKQTVPFVVSAVKSRYAAATSANSSVAKRISAAMAPALESSVRSRLEGYEEVVSIRCRFRPLGDFLREQGIERVDLLKVDTEGDELRVLRGVQDSQWSAIRQIVMEVDGVGQASADEVEGFLRARGYLTERSEQKFLGADFSAAGFVTHRPMMLAARRAE